MLTLAANICTEEFRPLWNVVGIIINVVWIGVPILLIVLGSIDLGKAVMAGDEKEIKASTSILVKRAIAAVAVFLLVLLVSVITGWVGGDEWKQCWSAANTNVKINPLG